jgi:protein transport protein SEC13
MTAAAQTIESGHHDVVHDVQMDYYGKRLATCSSDRTIKVFSVTGDQHTHLADLTGEGFALRSFTRIGWLSQYVAT